jgi:cysteine desulfurase
MGVASARELNAARTPSLPAGVPERVHHFTSGGSESNNHAVFGAVNAKIRRGREVVTTAAEHSSVAFAMKRLEETGWTVTRIKPDSSGNIDPNAVADSVTGQTALVSMMMVNNETGAIFPIEQASKLIRAKNPQTLIHCAGVQTFGKLPLRVSRMEIDLMSVSGHKICAPKGSGALYIRRGVRILPLIYGGGQERGLRSGTESLPMIAAFGAACGALEGHVQEHYHHAAALKARLLEKLSEIDGYASFTRKQFTLSMQLLGSGYRSETMLHFLESRGVYVSSGSPAQKAQRAGLTAWVCLRR